MTPAGSLLEKINTSPTHVQQANPGTDRVLDNLMYKAPTPNFAEIQ